MSIDNVERDWDRMADSYNEFVSSEHSYSQLIEHPAILRLLPSLEGKTVLDAGCGAGHSTFLLETQKPQHIFGVDISPGMIALAEHHKIRLGSKAEFRVGNLHDLACFSSGTFDLVFSSTVTHYLDIDIFFKECWNVLRTGGILLLSIIHPIYTAQYPLQHADGSLTDDHEWEIRYLEASLRSYVQPWVELSGEARYTVTSYHYTFSDYFRALLGSGFDVTGLDEPMPPPIFEQLYPERYQSYLKTPTFALIRAIKPS